MTTENEGVKILDAELVGSRAEIERLKAEVARLLKLAAAIEQVSVAVGIMRGPNMTFEYANRAYLQAVGKTDLVRKALRDAFPEIAGQGHAELLERIMETGGPFVGREVPIQLVRNGILEQTYFTFVYQALYDAEKRIDGVMATGHDVTEEVLAKAGVDQTKKDLERHYRLLDAVVEERTQKLQTANEELVAQGEELQAHQAQLQTINADLAAEKDFVDQLFAKMPGGVVIRDENMIITRANDRWLEWLGLKAEDVIGRSSYEVFPENMARMRPLYESIRDTGETNTGYSYSFIVRNSDGTTRETYWDYSTSPLYEGGRFRGYITLSFEVTRRVEVERALLVQQDLTRRIIDSAPSGISYMNRDLVYEWVNPTQAEFWGIPIEQVVGRSVFDVFGPGTEVQIGPLLRGVIEGGTPYVHKAFPFEFTIAAEKRFTYWDMTYEPVYNGSKEVQGVLVLAHEVSERVEKEKLHQERIAFLEQANVHKEQFLSILSHELRTPINAIMGFTSLLDDEVMGPLTNEQHGYMTKILDGSERMLALINDLLDMSRIQAGKFAISPGRINVNTLCHETVAALQALAGQKGVALACEAVGELPAVCADQQRVEQVLTNLLGNAIKFTPAGGHIRVSAEVVGAELRIEVQDTGIGIAVEQQRYIFDAFTQVDMSNTRKSGGAGLGLAICKSLVESHGGRLGVESSIGAGSTFWFTLPLEVSNQSAGSRNDDTSN